MPGLELDNTLKCIPAFHSYVAQIVEKRTAEIKIMDLGLFRVFFSLYFQAKLKNLHQVFATPE